MFKIHVVKKSFRLEMTIEEFKKILDYDLENGYSNGLFAQLSRIEGISDIDYSGHYGPAIFFDVDITGTDGVTERQVLYDVRHTVANVLLGEGSDR